MPSQTITEQLQEFLAQCRRDIKQGNKTGEAKQRSWGRDLKTLALLNLEKGKGPVARGYQVTSKELGGASIEEDRELNGKQFIQRQRRLNTFSTDKEAASLGELFDINILVHTREDGTGKFFLHTASYPGAATIELKNYYNKHFSYDDHTIVDSNTNLCLYYAIAQGLNNILNNDENNVQIKKEKLHSGVELSTNNNGIATNKNGLFHDQVTLERAMQLQKAILLRNEKNQKTGEESSDISSNKPVSNQTEIAGDKEYALTLACQEYLLHRNNDGSVVDDGDEILGSDGDIKPLSP